MRERLDRAVAGGELPASVDPGTLADFVMTVLHGLSIQARDGASAASMLAVADLSMLAWDRLAGTAAAVAATRPAG